MGLTRNILRTALVSLLFIPGRLSAEEKIRTWTSQSGAKAEAAFVSESAGMITVKTAEGKTLQFKRSVLVPADEAYLAKILYKPKMVTVSLEPNTSLGKLVYTEASPSQSQVRQSAFKRVDDAKKNSDANQADTVIFRIKSDLDAKWYDDSTWNILLAEVLHQSIAGNTKNKGEKRVTDGRYVQVTYKITNNGKNERPVPVPKLIDSADRKFNVIDQSYAFVPDQYSDPYVSKLAPGFTRTYCSIYEIPKDSGGLRAEISTLDLFDFEGTYIQIGQKQVLLDVTSTK